MFYLLYNIQVLSRNIFIQKIEPKAASMMWYFRYDMKEVNSKQKVELICFLILRRICNTCQTKFLELKKK